MRTGGHKASPVGCRGLRILLAGCFLFCTLASTALAELRVSGAPAAVVVETRGATIEEVLKALQGRFKFRYRSSQALSGVISGTYSGSLQRVITRLLEGHNYVFRNSTDGLEVSIFAPNAPVMRPVVGAPNEPLKECRYDDGVRIIPVEC